MSPPDPARSRRIARWVFPFAQLLACALALVPWFLAGISLCGISGCSGGGFGVTDSLRAEVIPFLALAAAVVTVPVLTLPIARMRIRVWIAVGLFAVTFAAMGAQALWALSGAAAPNS